MAARHFGLVGTGGCGRTVMPIARAQMPDDVHLYYVESSPTASQVNGMPVLSINDFLALEGDKFFNVAIADSVARKAVVEKMSPHAKAAGLLANTAVILDAETVSIGEGLIFCSYALITANVKIGKFFHANSYAYIEHDCVIGDYVTFAPGVKCNGNVHIHDHAYIGAGAIIRQGTAAKPLVIGEGAVIGMGAVVTKDVPPHTTVIGNPAKPQIKA